MDANADASASIDSLWNYGDPLASEQKFRALLAAGGHTDAFQGELLTQISRACCLQRQYAAARQALETALPLLRQDANRGYVRYLLEAGRLANDQGDLPRCLALFESAWQLACECRQDFLAVDAAHMLGYAQAGAPSIVWHERAIQKSQASADPKAKNWLFTLYSNLGKKYVNLGNFTAARDAYQQGMDIGVARSLPAQRLRQATWNLAFVWRKAGNTAQALAMQTELLRALDDPNDDLTGYIYEELAECHLEMRQAAAASAYFAKAYAYHKVDPWFPPLETARLERIKKLAQA